MAKKFGALRSEMSPAAQARAAQRAQRMLAEMPPQALEIYNGNRIREFDESEAEPAQGLSRESRSKKSISQCAAPLVDAESLQPR
jgi:hypothetical protein